MPSPRSADEIDSASGVGWRRAVANREEPLVLRGLVAQWPLVQAALRSDAAALEYLRRYYRNATVGAWFGPPAIRGRFFYNEEFSGFNFEGRMVKLDQVLDELERHRADPEPPAVYVGSTTIDTCLPGLRAENDVGDVPPETLASIWLGNRTRIAAHFDMPDNLACVTVGRRRFMLFEPGELPNLYAGPLEFTPAGQQISLVDIVNPDLDRHPRFAGALGRARVAELGAGDALYIPGMWWHHVEALEPVNVLINYWWQGTPAYLDAPVNALLHAILSVRALPAAQRAAWRGFFDHYVFNAGDSAAEHIPPRGQGVLGPIDEPRARALRALLLKKLNR